MDKSLGIDSWFAEVGRYSEFQLPWLIERGTDSLGLEDLVTLGLHYVIRNVNIAVYNPTSFFLLVSLSAHWLFHGQL